MHFQVSFPTQAKSLHEYITRPNVIKYESIFLLSRINFVKRQLLSIQDFLFTVDNIFSSGTAGHR